MWVNLSMAVAAGTQRLLNDAGPAAARWDRPAFAFTPEDVLGVGDKRTRWSSARLRTNAEVCPVTATGSTSGGLKSNGV